jgi:nicotinamidase-related amidase
MSEPSATAQQIPPAPAPVPVVLDPATTALVVMDITDATCSPQANCRAMLPRISALVAKAREAGLIVAYTLGATGGTVLPEAAPKPDDAVVQAGQNKFFNSTLDDVMRRNGIKTIILAGWRANGSITYTSHGAVNLRYTVVVPVDATSAPNEFEVAIGFYQILNLLSGNPTNEPLKPGAVTLSRTDLITFK